VEQKLCTSCGEHKNATEFYAHKAMKDGHLNKCKDCVKFRVRKHRENNDSVREYDKRRYRENLERRAKSAARTKEHRLKFPEKYKARTAVGNAIRDKRLTKKPCMVCGSIKSTAHHEDYSKPLEVKWLCHLHHIRLHFKV
jgi:ribosome-binding protein aMBF1 (putative translation factor)